jgi:hypothetical protein
MGTVQALNRKAYGLTLAFALMLSCMAGLVRRADANFIGAFVGLPAITIQSDGSVVPQTEYITREGSVYKLTADLQQTYAITINCSNIVFDGAGHIINGSGNVFWNDRWYGYNCEGITVESQTNVTIKNVMVTGFEKPAIYVENCSGVSISKVQTELLRFSGTENSMILESITPVDLMGSDNNFLCENILELYISISNNNLVYDNNINRITINMYSSNNLIYMNNINSAFSYSSNFWDNGSIGNYWGGYSDRYPDALEIGNSGVANTPYVIDEDNVDNYPLMRPVSTEQEADAAPFLLTLFAGVSTVLIVVVAVGLLVYFKKHKS